METARLLGIHLMYMYTCLEGGVEGERNRGRREERGGRREGDGLSGLRAGGEIYTCTCTCT